MPGSTARYLSCRCNQLNSRGEKATQSGVEVIDADRKMHGAGIVEFSARNLAAGDSADVDHAQVGPRMSYLADLEGNLIELVSRDPA